MLTKTPLKMTTTENRTQQSMTNLLRERAMKALTSRRYLYPLSADDRSLGVRPTKDMHLDMQQQATITNTGAKIQINTLAQDATILVGAQNGPYPSGVKLLKSQHGVSECTRITCELTETAREGAAEETLAGKADEPRDSQTSWTAI